MSNELLLPIKLLDQPSSKLCKLNPKYHLVAFLATILFIFITSTRLKLNNHIAYLFSDLVLVTETTPNITINKTTLNDNRCHPIKPSFIPYSAIIDGVKYPKGLPLYRNDSINFECLRKSNVTKRIFAWNPFFGDFNYANPFEKECPVTNCVFTHDRNIRSGSSPHAR